MTGCVSISNADGTLPCSRSPTNFAAASPPTGRTTFSGRGTDSTTSAGGLLDQLGGLDLDLLDRLYTARDQSFALPPPEKIRPVPVVPQDSPENPRYRASGEEALRRGEVAALVVAGGQGSRLRFDQPKGMYPIGPVTNKSLFQIHAEKVLALRRRFASSVPLLVMTSEATDDETKSFFAENAYFGLPKEDVFFFKQGTMPALDLATGRLLMESPGRLFLSPDGHGGALTALASSRLLDQMRSRGVRHIFYFQVDNPLVKVADPTFLGCHVDRRSEASSRVLPKLGPKDRLGNFVQIDGRCTIIEYSDLPDDLARQTDASGRLRLWAGSPAIHIFDAAFLVRMTAGQGRIPFHVARKKAPFLDDAGNVIQPTTENALKFERFIFDVLPLADQWMVMETSRREEFAPLKNADGEDSPQAVRQAISDLAADWLRAAGATVSNEALGRMEISPLFAFDAAELAQKAGRGTVVDGPKCFG
jgi:UDP-N-acetylglucosamine/UDP-N-acetylgalactosamine diphosphorylase